MRKLYLNAAILAALFFCRAEPVMSLPRLTRQSLDQKMSGSSPDMTGLSPIIIAERKAPPLVANLYWSGAFCASQNCEGSAGQESYAFSHGFKLNFGALDARLFNSCKKTSGADLRAIDSFDGYEEIFCNRRWSVSLDLSKFSDAFAGTFALGSLKFYSQKRLAPFFASISPFVGALGDAGELRVSLPTKSSSARDDAIFAAVSFKALEKFSTDRIRLMPLRAEFGISKNESDQSKAPFLAGLSGGFFYYNFFKLTAGLMFRRYYYEGFGDAAATIDWFDSVPTWKRELLNAACADICVEIPHLKSRTTFGIAQSPQSLGRKTISQEFLAAAKNLSVAAAFFASDNIFSESKTPYVAANATEYKKLWQAKITPQLLFKLKKGATLKLGCGGLLEERLVDWQKKTEHNSLEARFAAGFQIAGKLNSFRLTGTSGAAVLRQTPAQETVTPLPKAGVTAAFSHKFAGGRGGRLSVTCGASFQPEFYWEKREWIERLKISYYPRNIFLSSVSAGFEASQKEDKRKFTPSVSANFLFKLKGLRINASVSTLFPFGG